MINFLRKAITVSLSFLMIFPLSSFAETAHYHDKYAKYVIVSDMDTGRILYQKNPDTKSAMASMSKIMTLAVTLDALKSKKVSLNDVVTIQNSDVNREGSNIKLSAGEKITLDQLLHGLMIVSGNDAALAIARYIGKTENNFVNMMNVKAREIGMKNTIFYNPNGLPQKTPNGTVENTTTARDVLTLTKWMYKNYPHEVIRITDSAKYVDKSRGIDEANTNPLLPLIPSVDGLKTGFTPKAGYCLAFSMSVPKGNGNSLNNRFFGVTMGSPDKNARKLSAYDTINFINNNYKTIVPYTAGSKVTTAPINNYTPLMTDMIVHKDVVAVKRNTEKLKPSFVYSKISIGDVSKKPIGKMVLKNSSGVVVSRADIYADKISELPITAKLRLWLSAIHQTITNGKTDGSFPIITI